MHRISRPPALAMRFALSLLGASALTVTAAAPAHAATYTFVNVADSAELGFDPFSFGCATINNGGSIAIRAGRLAQDGFNTIPGIYRANRDGSLSVIAENDRRFDFIGFNPSMNDLGTVSFAAGIDGGSGDDFEAILTGNGTRVSTIADTRGQFNFFGFDTSINNRFEVAFKAELDEEDGFDEGLFSGRRGNRIITHYLASTSRFDGTDSRPSINNRGTIAFNESVNFNLGVFAGREGRFGTIQAPDPDIFVSEPVINDSGVAAFERSFVENDLFVTQIVTGTVGGPVVPVVDTRGPFAEFGFRPPALNNAGDVAFLGTLDDFTTTGVFAGPDPVTDRVIVVGDTLDGDTVTGLRFCEEGLNDFGRLTFTADFQDPTTGESRTAVFRATPAR